MAEHVVGIWQFRSALIHYVELAAGGDTVLILRRGTCVARVDSSSVHVAVGENRCSPVALSDRVSVAVLRSQTVRYLDRIASGEVVEVVRGGRPIARISGYSR